MTLTKANCTRCNGSGKFSFNLTRGTVCFGCNGSGFMMIDLIKEQKRLAKKAIADAIKKESVDARVAAGNKAYAELIEKYKNDLRIGSLTKQKCNDFEAVAHQTYKLLEAVDSGKYIHSIKYISE